MIFGSQFYPLLDKMTNWRQSLFALVLATRQYPNYELWTEIENRQGAAEFKKALQLCWEFHFDKFNHIDLMDVFEQIAPYLPESTNDDGELDSAGAYFAFDAAISLNAVIDAITLFTSSEASSASKASMASLVRYCGHKYDIQGEDTDDADNIDVEEILLEKPEILAEIDFQVELSEQVQKPRTPELVLSLLEYALKSQVSNLGLESKLKIEDFYKPEEWKQRAEEAQAKAVKAEQKSKTKAAGSKSTGSLAQKGRRKPSTGKRHAKTASKPKKA